MRKFHALAAHRHHSLRRNPSTARLAAAAAACALIGAAPAPAHADKVGTVSAATAAKQLRKGLPSTATESAAKARMANLVVRSDASMSGYDRDKFPHWRDASTWGWPVAPNNSCDARNAALFRDGAGVKMSSTCTRLTGTWVDPYGAGKYNAPADIDIDHVVPLAEAYRTGAKSWTTSKRTKFANDPLVLVSSYDRLNQAKSDQAPETWMPPNKAAHCAYATRWVYIKYGYKLTVTKTEKSALWRALSTC